MVVEIRKAGFSNKGAELMLRSAVEQVCMRLPDAKIVVIPHSPNSYCERARLCLYQKLWLYRFGIRFGNVARIIPEWVRHRYGLYVDYEVDVVLDAAGFVYSDQTRLTNLTEAAQSSRKWKRRGAKLILLPQAFGPFSDRKRRALLKKLIHNADLVYAREKASYEYITEVVGQQEHVKIAPDFTNLMTGYVPDGFDHIANRFCVIPNHKMLGQTDEATATRYIEAMASMIVYLQNSNAKPFLLIHGDPNDRKVAERILSKVAESVQIIEEKNALGVKGIIGQSDGVISSRFHGLVSALSQGVPAIGTTWSHKYRMLFEDYEFLDGMIDVHESLFDLNKRIDMILKEPTASAIRKTIERNAEVHKKAAADMWAEVFSFISESTLDRSNTVVRACSG